MLSAALIIVQVLGPPILVESNISACGDIKYIVNHSKRVGYNTFTFEPFIAIDFFKRMFYNVKFNCIFEFWIIFQILLEIL